MANVSDFPRRDNPEIIGALDTERREEIARQAGLAANLWMSMKLAAARGDDDLMHGHIQQIRLVSKAVVDLLNLLGSEEAHDG